MLTMAPPGPAVEIGAALLDRARRGDQEAFAAVIRHYDSGLRTLAYRLLGDRDRMDDVLQEAYARAFHALPRFRGGASAGSWLYRIVYNACVDELRRSGARKEISLEDWRERAAAPDVEQRLDLEAALAKLPVDLRAVVLLVDADELSYDEAAEILGIPAGTVASRLSRARDALRGALR
jgi:RNA polymerase sigma-70 factor, ECF subfamily